MILLSDEFGSLGTNTDCGSYWGTPLDFIDRGRGKFIPTCGLLGWGNPLYDIFLFYEF